MRVIGGEVVETQRHVAQPEEFLHFYQTARTLAFHSVLCSNLRNANSLCEAVLILLYEFQAERGHGMRRLFCERNALSYPTLNMLDRGWSEVFWRAF